MHRTRSAGRPKCVNISRRAASETVSTSFAWLHDHRVISRRRRPSFQVNHSGRATNEMSWTRATVGTFQLRGAVYPGAKNTSSRSCFAAFGSASCSHTVPPDPGTRRTSTSARGVVTGRCAYSTSACREASGSWAHASSSPARWRPTPWGSRRAREHQSRCASRLWIKTLDFRLWTLDSPLPPPQQRVFVRTTNVTRSLRPVKLPRPIEATTRAGGS